MGICAVLYRIQKKYGRAAASKNGNAFLEFFGNSSVRIIAAAARQILSPAQAEERQSRAGTAIFAEESGEFSE